jgi:putative addiction module killer protein
MYTFLKSDEFNDWLIALKDQVAKAKIALRLDRAAKGHFGDCEPVCEGVLRDADSLWPRLPFIFYPA